MHIVFLQVHFDWESEGVLYDRDGTLTGNVGHSAVPCTGSFDSSKCPQDNSGTFNLGVPGCICNDQVKLVR